jgi:hypothetical protein
MVLGEVHRFGVEAVHLEAGIDVPGEGVDGGAGGLALEPRKRAAFSSARLFEMCMSSPSRFFDILAAEPASAAASASKRGARLSIGGKGRLKSSVLAGEMTAIIAVRYRAEDGASNRPKTKIFRALAVQRPFSAGALERCRIWR